MLLNDWIKEQIEISKEILANLEQGVRYSRSVNEKALIDITEEYKAETENRLVRNVEILEALESKRTDEA